MADALHYLHGKNIMHRDIKPENILIGKLHTSTPGLVLTASGLNGELKLADFGWSVVSKSLAFPFVPCQSSTYPSSMPQEIVETRFAGPSITCRQKW